MAIPKAVQKIGEEADKLAVEHGLLKKEEGGDPANPKLEVVEEVATNLQVETEDWEKRFKNYKITTDQTIAGLRNELVTAQQKSGQDDNKIADLTERMQALEAAAKPTEQNTVVTAKKFDVSLLPEEMRNEYEPEYLQNMVNIIQQVQGTGNDDKTLLELKQELEDLKGSVNAEKEDKALTAREEYYKVLDKNQPTWEQIGAMPEFVEFLKGKVNELLPQTYGNVLSIADNNSDAGKVLSVIAAYQQAGGKIDSGLEDMLTPDGGAAHGGDGGDLKPSDQLLTEGQITQFNLDVTKGVYKNKPDEKAAIEKQIEAQYSAPG